MNIRSFILPEIHNFVFEPSESTKVTSATTEANELTNISTMLNKLASEKKEKDTETWSKAGSIYAG